MKRVFLGLLAIVIIISIAGCNNNNNPYAGEYKTSDNTILELNSNGKCKVINNSYKDVFYTYGKYTINDNKIEITFDEDKQNYMRVKSLSGEVKGSNIEFYDYLGKESTYSKVE
ncbi:hypothetical protein [Clostridium beijerinckii]|uniref:hypothetical protein n=1 Tax=Clostridium beijerinckii TaxID=1520 RepID=UPI00098CB62D|nr:hypothetical protein [Clostridium beijerinckii]MBA8937058.1 uncharacterized protein YxeA [Clostridium beijerinckii]NRU40476.1 uncharacterized protein YxeA [Clostridium beijerinckii]NSA96248.1 uncharacterized protein YxeA [Clostridium beijerinckii]OOM60141.1 hypothetical protein CLOBI_32350 [Clostridium beijerinckii]OOM68155.1 hypothetical protein CLBEIC_35310 [Clostridium beijerinckii]